VPEEIERGEKGKGSTNLYDTGKEKIRTKGESGIFLRIRKKLSAGVWGGKEEELTHLREYSFKRGQIKKTRDNKPGVS